MPNRCGMIHVRGPIPPNRITHGEGEKPLFVEHYIDFLGFRVTKSSLVTFKFVNICQKVQQWQKGMEEKLSPLFSLKEILSEDEATKMGRKDPEEEVEKFVSANTQELGKDKWLCPLSGKKFKVRH